MRRWLGRIGEWAVTRPAPTIVAVISIVAIVGIVGALRLSPDAGTDKLVDNGSSAFEGTQEFRERFGDDAIVVLVKGDLDQLVLTKNIDRLLSLETCLAGKPDPSTGRYAASSCQQIHDLGATRVVFGPATFLNEAATRAQEAVRQQIAAAGGISAALQDPQLQQQVLQSGLSPLDFVNLSIDNTNFVQSVVYDLSTPGRPPKSKFGYLFPSDQGALISIRLQPDVSDGDRREAISLINQTVDEDAFALKHDAGYEVSGIPVVVQGLSDELGGQIAILFGAALAVMALVLIFIFGPPLRLLPLLIALGAAGFAFGLLSLLGGTLTMASVAVLPVVIGLAVDYAIQLQARFREAAERGERPPAAAVIAAVRGGPVIGTAALATAVGFLSLVLSPIPMVREFAIALVVGIFAALAISLTAGLAALSMTTGERRARASGVRFGRRGDVPGEPNAGWREAGRSLISTGRGVAGLLSSARTRAASAGRSALAASIEGPGRVLAVGTVLAVAGWAAGTATNVVSDIRELVPSDLPALRSVDDLQSATGVSGELNVLVSGDVTSPEAITWMKEFKQRVLQDHGFDEQGSSCLDADTTVCPGPALSDLFDLTPTSAPGEDPGYTPPSPDRVSAVLDQVPPYFSQAILSRSDQGDVANVSFLIPVMPLDEQESLIDDIRGELDPPAGVSAEVVGLPVLAADANSELSSSRYWLTVVGLLAVGLVLLAVYRRLGRALVPLIPIALATGWSSLVLELIGIPLNPMSATLGVLVIAISTEFSVILAARYYEERATGVSIGQALRLTYSRTGTAVLASGITSIAGFGVLAFSGITMLRDFGIATVVDLSVALAGVMLVLPAALVWAESGFSPLPALISSVRQPRRAEPPGTDPNPTA